MKMDRDSPSRVRLLERANENLTVLLMHTHSVVSSQQDLIRFYKDENEQIRKKLSHLQLEKHGPEISGTSIGRKAVDNPDWKPSQ